MVEVAQNLGEAERTPREHRHHDQDDCADHQGLGSENPERRGTAVNVVRIWRLPYSLVMASAPRIPTPRTGYSPQAMKVPVTG